MKIKLIFIVCVFFSIDIFSKDISELPLMTESKLSDIFESLKDVKENRPYKDPFMTDEEYRILLDAYKSRNLEINKTYKMKIDMRVPCYNPVEHCYDPNNENFIINYDLRTEYGGKSYKKKFIHKTDWGEYKGQTGLQKNIGTYSNVTKWHQYYNVLNISNITNEKILFSQKRDDVKKNFDEYSFYIVFDVNYNSNNTKPDFKRKSYNEATISNPTERKTYERYLQAEYKYHFATFKDDVIFKSVGDHFPLSKPKIIDYPKKALKRDIQGYVTVLFDVNKDGTTTSHKILASRCIRGGSINNYSYSKSIKEQMDGFLGNDCKIFNKSALKTASKIKYNINQESRKSYTIYYLGY